MFNSFHLKIFYLIVGLVGMMREGGRGKIRGEMGEGWLCWLKRCTKKREEK